MDIGITLADFVLLFFVYGFLGWCAEVAFAACKHGKFVNRGFLNGPICPIYGFGLVAVVALLWPVHDNLWLLYFGSVALTTLIELVTGYLLEKIFHAKWWDYSKMPLNIGGYVCLLFSLIWGVACIAFVRWIHPLIYGLIDGLPNLLVYILGGALIATIAADVVATVASIRKLSARLAKLTELAAEIRELSDNLGENIAERTLATRKHIEEGQQRFEERQQRIEEIIEEGREQSERRVAELRAKLEDVLGEKRFGHRRLLEAFPNLVSKRNSESLEHLRASLEERRKRGKRDAQGGANP